MLKHGGMNLKQCWMLLKHHLKYERRYKESPELKEGALQRTIHVDCQNDYAKILDLQILISEYYLFQIKEIR